MAERSVPNCPECGNPIDSRVHLEGLGDIHTRYERPESVPAAPKVAHDILMGMTNNELVALAEERGREVPRWPTKAQLVALLEA